MKKEYSSQQEVALLKKLSKKQQTEDGKVRCSNCGKQIVESKIEMHEGYCIKNCKKCPYCSEFMTDDMLEEHIEQSHVKCAYCNKRIDVNLQEAHQKVCLKGGRKCRFCDVSVQLEKLPEHEERCGAQTDNCLYCFKFILKKEMNLHDKICPMKNEQFTLAPLLKQQSVVKQSKLDFLNDLKNEIIIFSEQSNISKGQAIYLFNEYGWDLEKSPIFPTLAFAPYTKEEQQQQDQGKNLSNCLVCLQKLGEKNFYALRCGHRACDDCFKQWVLNSFQNGPLCLDTKCLFDGCQERVGPEGFEKYLQENEIQKYWGFVQQSALHTHPYFLMCPNPKCQSILRQKSLGSEEKIHMRKKQFNAVCDECQTSKLELGKIPEQLNFLSFDQFSEVYFKSYSLILEAQIICQWCNIIDLYQLYPQPVVQIWVEQQLKNQIKSIEKILCNPEFSLDEFNHLKQLKITISKLIKDIYEAFQGISQKKNLDPEIVNKVLNDHINLIDTVEQEEVNPFQPSNEIQRDQEEQDKKQQEIAKIDEEQQQQDKYFKELTEVKCVECKKNKATIEQQYCNQCFNQLYCYNEDDYEYDDDNDYNDDINDDDNDIMEEDNQQNIKNEIKTEQEKNNKMELEEDQQYHNIKQDMNQEQLFNDKNKETNNRDQGQNIEQNKEEQKIIEKKDKEQNQDQENQQQDIQFNQQNQNQMCQICNSNKSTMDGGYCDNCFELCFG
ncbi:TRAF-like protein [Pseudocohnilembus persalinus]|uniref:TRAF-like protein n=1 Tax=Pseudocohnilembus persalinus TaxID=266149 RepID=A0A0V0QPM9_PSEPJ|nr:TRAF-like protein [Pseudocohnilembus persalinus]|eukprot:KRX03973.1 TRAF-like protein [Pseudocohnilembus persalinus]